LNNKVNDLKGEFTTVEKSNLTYSLI